MSAVSWIILCAMVFVAGYAVGYLRMKQPAPVPLYRRRALEIELRAHPGAKGVVEALEEARESFAASTTPRDLATQDFEGEWHQCAELCTRLITMLRGET